MKILDGKKVRNEILNEVKKEIELLDRELELAVVQVGTDPASSVYVRHKDKMAHDLCCNFRHLNLSENISESRLGDVIEAINYNEEIDGILLQLPVSKHIKANRVIDCIDPDKDVDGLNSVNVSRLDNNEE